MINLNGEFVWWFGVVEDVQDPKKLGRAKVRIHGYHTANQEDISTTDLPWAHPIFPVTGTCNSGVGVSVPGFLPGTHVFGFFLDGKEDIPQQPMIMGTVPGVNAQENIKEEGLNDPYDNFPRQQYLGKPDTNILAYGPPEEGTPTFNKIPVEEVPTGDGETWNEHTREFPSKYPFNKLYESMSGHLIEIDDSTPPEDFVGPFRGNGRIHIYHNSGSFIEIHPNGEMVIKSTGGGYKVTMGDDNMYVQGNLNITTDGNATFNAKNYIFKGEKATFQLSDDFQVNCKNFNAQPTENINMVAGADAQMGGTSKANLVGGGGNIRLQGGMVELNPPG